MKNRLINWSILLALMIISILPGFAYSQVVSGSVNTPSGYSIDGITGNLIPYDSSLKTSTGVTGSFYGSFDAADGYTFSYINETIGYNSINLGGFAHGYQNTGAVFVTGFTYGLKYRFPCANSIGGSCDNTSGPQDTLRVDIGYYPYSGSPEFRFHQLGLKNIEDGNSAYNPNWQQLAETWVFAGAKPIAQAGAVNMAIVGQDAGFWSCLMPDCYGPQVKDAYVRANYSVDPCILNPAFNSNCPGFNNVVYGSKSPTFYYSYNIAQSLPHIGGGVQLHGYDYGFNWWNYGSCYNTFIAWCTDWRTDGGGNINFRISDSSNNTMFYNYWYVGGNNSGGSYSNRVLLTESQNSLSMGSVQWWTDSVWNHFGWNGWTKPIWNPDPCYDQPLYSPNCSNFEAEIKRLAAEQKALQDAQLATTVSSVSTTPTSTVTTTINDANSTNPTVNVVTNPLPPPGASPPPGTPPPPGSAPLPPGSAPPPPGALPSPPNQVASSSARNVNVPVIENNSVALALNIISKNRENDIQVAAIAQQAVTEADVKATTSVKEAEKVAENLTIASVATSIEAFRQAEQASSGSIQNRTNSTATLALSLIQAPTIQQQISSPQQLQQITRQQEQQQEQVQQTGPISTVSVSSAVQILAPNNMFRGMESVTIPQTIFSAPVQTLRQEQRQEQQTAFQQQDQQQNIQQDYPQPQQQVQQIVVQPVSVFSILSQTPQVITESQQIIQQTFEPAIQQTFAQESKRDSFLEAEQPQQTRNFTTDRTNPINDIIDNKPMVAEQKVEPTNTSLVNRNAQNNNVAGSVDISSLAVVPAGFNSYNIALKDVAFYQPKEIYRNQRTTDNRRALQNLRSDQLHEQMKNQQWR